MIVCYECMEVVSTEVELQIILVRLNADYQWKHHITLE